MILSELLSTIIQLIAFGIIPFLWWIFTVRKTKSFHAWLGLTAPKAEDEMDKAVQYVVYRFDNKETQNA